LAWRRSVVVLLGSECEFQECLACGVAAIDVAERDAFVLVGFQLYTGFQALQYVFVEEVFCLFVVDGVVVELFFQGVMVVECSAFYVVICAVQLYEEVYFFRSFFQCELLEVFFELLVFCFLLAGSAYDECAECDGGGQFFVVYLHIKRPFCGGFLLLRSGKDILFFEIMAICLLINVKNMPHSIKEYIMIWC
jgi:hypothetical protein